MSRLPRVSQKIFASAAGGSQVAQIGSLFAGTPTFTTNIAVAQALNNFTEGLFNICIGNNSPAIEDFNGIFLVLTQQLAYLMQAGVAEWDAGTTYYIGSIAQDGLGNQYVSLVDTNLNNALSDGTKWKGSPGVLPLGSVIATFPNLIGAYVTTATTVADSQGYVLCVGQVISDASSPMNGRTIPNINNDVFLMGSTASDAPGGSNSTMLTNTQLPSHTHGAGSYATSLGVTGGTASLTGTTTFPAFNHTHAFGHSHAWGAGSPSFLETRFTDDYTSTTGGSDVFQANSPFGNGPSSSIAIPQMLASAVTTFYTSGITQSAGVGTGAFASTGVESADSTVGISSTPASTTGSNSVTGSSSSTGTGSAYDSRPLFISCVYLMRIK